MVSCFSSIEVDGTRKFYHFDEMGNTVMLSDDSGAISDGYALTPYGRDAIVNADPRRSEPYGYAIGNPLRGPGPFGNDPNNYDYDYKLGNVFEALAYNILSPPHVEVTRPRASDVPLRK